MTKPSLEGRQARCICHNVVDSDYELAFFEYRGPGSPSADKQCECGYYEVAHTPRDDGYRIKCEKFVPHGPWRYDMYYCGCRGWD
jgi:hypothetical protein